MRKEKKKAKWSKPELVVLVRGKPEEGILAGCKSGLAAGAWAGSFASWVKCSVSECGVCAAYVLS